MNLFIERGILEQPNMPANQKKAKVFGKTNHAQAEFGCEPDEVNNSPVQVYTTESKSQAFILHCKISERF